jgi:hypothetical protein
VNSVGTNAFSMILDPGTLAFSCFLIFRVLLFLLFFVISFICIFDSMVGVHNQYVIYEAWKEICWYTIFIHKI